MIAVFGYITCWQTRRWAREQNEMGAGEFGYDFSRGYGAFDQPDERRKRPGFLARRRIAKAARRAEQERRSLERRQEQVETILAKISQSGMASLTPQERNILEEETQRHRSFTGDSNEFQI